VQKGDPPGGIKELNIKSPIRTETSPIDVGGDSEYYDMVTADPQFPKFAMQPELANIDALKDVPPSKNIENRGEYDIFDKFRQHPLFEEIVKQFREDPYTVDTKNPLSQALGVEDAKKRVDEAVLRTYGMKQIKEEDRQQASLRDKPPVFMSPMLDRNNARPGRVEGEGGGGFS